MNKLLVASTIALSMSFATSSHALDPVTAGAVAGGAEVAAGVAAAGAAVGGAAGAAVGAVTAAGIAVGVVAGAGAAGYVTSELMNDYAFKGDTSCSGCEPAQTATQIGAALGTGGAIGALAVAGADVAGLAAIGGAVGGGAIAGVGVLVAAPIVAAVAIGGVVYYWYSKEASIDPAPSTNQN
jgi:hypothetical protein